ncbi:MAG TPA: radical SAM protein [Deltaproteobacteria bacterium]|jgi:MoaA/NifB/PqqE/SkfB family radical SAM enzyme|nr:radical SAM protein [Deltaproteobacteria bacterium]HOI06078.1 radical SAM protein [Deltaproteobacteria bacterium]
MTSTLKPAVPAGRGTIKGPALRAAGFLGNFLTSRLLGRKAPLLASFKLTYRCNLSCLGCPFHQLAGLPGSHMTWPVALASLDALKAMGVKIVIFEGGEPLLWRDGGHTVSDLVQAARRLFPCVGATTNGTLPLDVPTDVLWVSVDGLKPAHDTLRSGSFDALMENIRASRHPKLFVHYTMNRRNWRDFPGAAREIMGLDAVRGITVQFFYPYNLGEQDLRLTGAERREAVDMVLSLKRNKVPIMNSRRGLEAMVHGNWRCHDWILANVEPDGGILTGCYAKNRGGVRCSECGFTPVAEASGAVDLHPGSLVSGIRIFVL